jgi:antitoxin StbD
MNANVEAREPKMPLFDMNMKSVSEIKRDYSKVIKEVQRDNEPAFVMNHNTPEAVLMSYSYYRNVIVDIQEKIKVLSAQFELLQDEVLYAKAESRLQKDPLVWLAAEEVIGKRDDFEVYRTAGKRIAEIQDQFEALAKEIHRKKSEK